MKLQETHTFAGLFQKIRQKTQLNSQRKRYIESNKEGSGVQKLLCPGYSVLPSQLVDMFNNPEILLLPSLWRLRNVVLFIISISGSLLSPEDGEWG